MYSSGERVDWDIAFTFDGKRYTVIGSHGGTDPLGAPEAFEIVRDSTAGGRDVVVAELTGSIDADTDAITIDMSLTGFNDGEAALAAKEGRDARPMKRGSVLADPATATHTSKIATNDTDRGRGWCDYVVGS
jgi:hypothetical protein